MASNQFSKVIDNGPVDCEGVDYKELEDTASALLQNVESYVMNVDIS